MAAYGAAVSLSKVLSHLRNSPNCPCPQIGVLLEGVDSLRRFLEDNREVKREFEIQIRDAVYEAQDVVDSHLSSAHFLSPSEAEARNQSFCRELERVIQGVNSLADVMELEEEFNDHRTLDRKISSSVWKTPDEIGVSCLLAHSLPVLGRYLDECQLKKLLMSGSAGLEVVPILGIAGMGKTAVARSIYEDPSVKEYFDASGWVKVSMEYKKRDKLLNLLESTKRRDSGIDQEAGIHLVQYNWSDEVEHKTDEQLVRHLYDSLKYKRYLIVLDDIRDLASWNDLKKLLPDYHIGSRILLTTRDVDVAHAAGTPHPLGRLSDASALTLLRDKLFYCQPWPSNLAVIAEDIVKSCRGLPHAIVLVGKLLLCAKPVAEYWQMVLSSISTCKNYAGLMDALISLTYNHLPQRLKVCFLYMAMFPYNYPIPLLKFMMIWTVERFVGVLEAGECWTELSLRGFLILRTKANDRLSSTTEIGEEVFHDFLVRKAKEESFFSVINKDHTSSISLQEDAAYNQQRRLCIQQNIRRFIKHLSKCNSNSSLRSLVYSGPKHPYPLQAWPEGFELLELLDAPDIGFYTFPPEILRLVQLKHLALSYNRQLPATISNLHNLQVLVVSHSLKVKHSGNPSHLPVQIWNLKELMHLQVAGSDLPEPPPDATDPLKTLKRLSDVSSQSCSRHILKRLPNLTMLEVLIESSPEDEPLSFFSHLDILNRLNEFKCVACILTSGLKAFLPPFQRFRLR